VACFPCQIFCHCERVISERPVPASLASLSYLFRATSDLLI
jgi:hypothetical protein